MMHHPSMHHQPMSGHPQQHLPGHQGMPAHHQMPPHQMHRENRHVTLTRVPLGPSQPGGGMGGHGPALGGMGAMGVPPPHHGPTQRPPHPIRAMQHHPPSQHHSVPPQQMKGMRRPYGMGGAYGGAGVLPYAPPPQMQPQPPQPPPAAAPPHTVVAPSQTTAIQPITTTVIGDSCDDAASTGSYEAGAEGESAGEGETPRSLPAHTSPANSKEKTPMCLVNELARYNKIKHQYRLTSETGPPHKKVFTVTLRLGESEEYTAEGSSIKRAQHAAAAAALGGTRCPPPPPRAAPPHQPTPSHHRHNGAVMPTVELNAMAMKLCQPAVYTMIPPTAAPTRPTRQRVPPPYCLPPPPPYVTNAYGRTGGALVYRVRVSVGGRAWLGAGCTPQAARHDAAARALHDLRTQHHAHPAPHVEESTDIISSEVKSPVSLVHELALKRNMSVQFTVKSERGPPHMRVFITACTVGDMETEGEGNGKKVSKRRAAEAMLEEMKTRWPPSLLKAKPTHDRRRQVPLKKKPRNLIKEAGAEGAAATDNPISRLAVWLAGRRARSPQYRVVEERGAARRREFLVTCDAPPYRALGHGPSKKAAKRRAAINVLLEMEQEGSGDVVNVPTGGATDVTANGAVEGAGDSIEIEGDPSVPAGTEVRQPVPGVILMDYNNRAPQNNQTTNGLAEASPPAGPVSSNTSGSSNSSPGGTGPGAKDKLLYLADLLGFTVQFSDFPKRNHGEYLSLVSLSTSPPVMCHGGGASTQLSHEHCCRAALRAIALMGLDQVQAAPSAGSKSAIKSSVSE